TETSRELRWTGTKVVVRKYYVWKDGKGCLITWLLRLSQGTKREQLYWRAIAAIGMKKYSCEE
ncbi:MAG: hypothetical protein WAN65_06465, partial [Candidatus Sulfotelmatobacter sp.]